jgi:hypothetical protein
LHKQFIIKTWKINLKKIKNFIKPNVEGDRHEDIFTIEKMRDNSRV